MGTQTGLDPEQLARSSSASMSSARESEHIISARETLDSECMLRRHLPGST